MRCVQADFIFCTLFFTLNSFPRLFLQSFDKQKTKNGGRCAKPSHFLPLKMGTAGFKSYREPFFEMIPYQKDRQKSPVRFLSEQHPKTRRYSSEHCSAHCSAHRSDRTSKTLILRRNRQRKNPVHTQNNTYALDKSPIIVYN